MNKINLYWKRLVLGGLLLSLTITGILNREENGHTELKVSMFAGSQWGVPNGNCYDIMDEAIASFERKYPHVHVTYDSGILIDDYSEWFSSKILEGDIPDVFMVLPQDFNMLVSIGTMMDMDKLMEADQDFDQNAYYASALEEGQYQGSQYALPYESVPTLMFVNKSLLAKEKIKVPGNDWTWDEFYDICKKVTKDMDGDGTLDQFGVYNYSWKNALYSNGTTIFSKEGTACNLNSPKALDAFEFTRKINQIPGYQKATADDFDLGKVAFYPMNFAEYRTYKPYPWRINKYFKFDWECIKLPAGPSGDNISGIESLLFGISSKSGQKKLAWEFLKILTYEQETQYKIFQKSQGISALKKVTNSKKVEKMLKADSPNMELLNKTLLNEIMEQAVVEEKFREYDSALQYIEGQFPSLMESDADLSSHLQKLQSEVNRLIGN